MAFAVHRLHTPRPRHAAFTLIELLVVIAILALLISILVPSLRKAKRAAMDSVCLSNLKQMGNAMAVYAAEWDDVIMPCGYDPPGWPPPSPPLPFTPCWQERCGVKYFASSYKDTSPDILHCPVADVDASPWAGWWWAWYRYSLNQCISPPYSTDPSIYTVRRYNCLRTFSSLAHTVILAGDGRLYPAGTWPNVSWYPNPCMFGAVGARADGFDSECPWPFSPAFKGYVTAHNGGANLLFTDGHAENRSTMPLRTEWDDTK